jgi:ABC-2 type transport system permease protein
MTMIADPPVPVAIATREPAPSASSSFWHNVAVMTRRNIIHVRREPAQLSDVTAQPVLFTILFIFVFGAGITVAGGSYKDFALAGLLTLNLTTSATGTAVGLSSDLSTGVIDRFRTLPIWRSSILVGRSIADLLAATLCVTIVGLTGLAVGWRPDAAIISVVGGFGVALLFSYAVSWGLACLGIVSPGPESAQGIGLLVLFPLAFVSNSMVPTQHMPWVLRTIADWNPVSAVASACRNLFGNPNPSSTVHAWPMQHPVVAAIGWSLLMLAVFVPLASFLFRRKTTE